MSFWELLLLAVGLSMDAFAVSICKGLSVKRVGPEHMLKAGLWFGGFQALMPALGYLLGTTFEKYITAVDHWVVFALLALIGINMIRESRSAEDDYDVDFGWRAMLMMALATSIDALAIGITFALLPNVNIVSAVTVIGITTFTFSAVGVKAGGLIGGKSGGKAKLIGGVILILIGLKILLEHLGILA